MLILPLLPDSLAWRAAIGLIDLLGLALLVDRLSLPLYLRRMTTRYFWGYRAVLVTRLLNIPVTDFVYRRGNGIKVVVEEEFGRVL